DLVVSAIYSDTEQKGSFPFAFSTASTARLEGPQLETQYVLRQERVTWVAGAGHFDGTQKLSGDTILGSSPDLSSDDKFSNGYAYAKLRNAGSLEITAGASYEDVTAPVGLLPPRDYLVTPGEVVYQDNRVSPKIGLTGYLDSKTVLRGAAYYRL